MWIGYLYAFSDLRHAETSLMFDISFDSIQITKHDCPQHRAMDLLAKKHPRPEEEEKDAGSVAR